MTRERLALGELGEEVAATYLASQGYRILARRWRAVGREVDLIAERHGIVVFVEVKSRKRDALTPAITAVDFRKRRQIAAVASVGALRWGEQARGLRFDVVTVTWESAGPRIDHIEDAFRLEA